MPLITTVIPTFRRPILLRRAIISVLNQTFSDFEVHVYDDASNDETSVFVNEIIQKDSRVKYHCHSSNIGSPANFNFGIKNVKTRFFSVLSDDDILFPKFYELALAGFEKYPEIFFSATDVMFVSTAGNVKIPHASHLAEGLYYPPKGFLDLIRCGAPHWNGILFKKECLTELGALSDIFQMVDYEYVLRIASRKPFAISHAKGSAFHVGTNNISVVQRLDPDFLKTEEIGCDLIIKNPELSVYYSEIMRKLANDKIKAIFISTVDRMLSGDSGALYEGIRAYKKIVHKKTWVYHFYLICLYSLCCGKIFAKMYNVANKVRRRFLKEKKREDYLVGESKEIVEDYIRYLNKICQIK